MRERPGTKNLIMYDFQTEEEKKKVTTIPLLLYDNDDSFSCEIYTVDVQFICLSVIFCFVF